MVAVKTVPIALGTANVELHAIGRLEALRTQDVLSPITGRVTSIKVLEGESVRSGEVIASIETRESKAALDGARILLSRAKSVSDRISAERAVALAESTRTRVEITAPFNGVISVRQATEGQVLSEGTSLLTVVDLNTLVFMADVQEGELSQIRIGQKSSVHLSALPDTTFETTVDAINPQSNPESQAVEVRLTFLESVAPVLKSGMTGTADIVIDTHPDALLVPKSAVLRNDETLRHSVVIVGPDSLSHTVQVEMGVQTDSTAEVASQQLKPGMQVIVEGQYALVDSTKVSATPQGMQ